MQLPTSLRTVEHYQGIADKFEELAATLALGHTGDDHMSGRLKHFAREIRENIRENINFSSLLHH